MIRLVMFLIGLYIRFLCATVLFYLCWSSNFRNNLERYKYYGKN